MSASQYRFQRFLVGRSRRRRRVLPFRSGDAVDADFPADFSSQISEGQRPVHQPATATTSMPFSRAEHHLRLVRVSPIDAPSSRLPPQRRRRSEGESIATFPHPASLKNPPSCAMSDPVVSGFV